MKFYRGKEFSNPFIIDNLEPSTVTMKHQFFLEKNNSNQTFNPHRSPPTALMAAARYEKMIEAFGGRGFCARKTDEINRYLTEITKDEERVALLNILISPMSSRKTQVNNRYRLMCTKIFCMLRQVSYL